MNKFAIILLIILMSSSAFAAKGTMKLGMGAVALGGNFILSNTPALIPTFKVASDNFNMEFGLNFVTQSSQNTTNTHFDILAKGDFCFSQGTVAPHAGGLFIFSSDSQPFAIFNNNQSASGFTLGGYYGATLHANPKFDISADVVPLMFTSISMGGVSTTIISIARGMLTGSFYF